MAGPNPKSVAVEGIGYGPLDTATKGYITDQLAGELVQTAGLASDFAFGTSAVSLFVYSLGAATAEEFGGSSIIWMITSVGFASSEDYGNAYGTSTVSASSLPSDEGFGAAATTSDLTSNGMGSDEAFAGQYTTVSIFSSGLSTDEAFGQSTVSNVQYLIQVAGVASEETFGLSDVQLSLTQAGLSTDEAFGVSNASYDQTLNQGSGLDSGEEFGSSSILSGEEDPNDYTNDSANVITKRRPIKFLPGRRGRSKVHDPESPYYITAESVGGDLDVKGSIRKFVENDPKISVVGKRITAAVEKVVEKESPTIECRLVEIRISSSIQVRAKRIKKAA